jgi:hypothetical protein
MPRRIPKVLLLVALLTAFVASSVPAFRSSFHCRCLGAGGCHFDTKSSQCIITSCHGACVLI